MKKAKTRRKTHAKAVRKPVERRKPTAKASTPTKLAKGLKTHLEGHRLIDAKERRASIQNIVRSNWRELGKLLKQGVERKDYEVLGYQNMRAWMEDCTYGSISGAWKALRIAKALQGIPEEVQAKLTEGKADLLSKLPEEVRKKPEWIKRATDPEVTNRDFGKKVAEHFGETDPSHVFYLKMSESAYQNVFEAVEKKVARLLSIDLEETPNRRLEVWEKACLFVLTTEDERFVIETEGATTTLEQTA